MVSSGDDMPRDVFISYSTKDKKLVEQICRALEGAGITCWMAHRDIPKTKVWAEEIPTAIEQCRLFLLIFTANANASKFVFKEVTYADDIDKPILNFRVEDFAPAKKYKLYLSTVQALDATTPPIETHLPELIETVRSLLPQAPAAPSLPPPARPTPQVKGLPPQKPAPRVEVASSPQPVMPTLPKTRVREKDGMVEVYIGAGEFLMGSADGDKEAYAHEKPQHKVYLDAYWMDQTPVTNAMFARFVAQTSHRTQAEEKRYGYVYNTSKERWEQTVGANWRHPTGPGSTIRLLEAHPVVQVNWEDALAYCDWAGAQLPTEAQWEKAARGTDGRKYPWGNQEADASLANFIRIIGSTTPVGSYPAGASPYKLLDMAGNVWEYCADWYGENYYRASPMRNPSGPASGSTRVVRGGCWYCGARNLRVTYRGRINPVSRGNFLGFRCIRREAFL